MVFEQKLILYIKSLKWVELINQMNVPYTGHNEMGNMSLVKIFILYTTQNTVSKNLLNRYTIHRIPM